MRSFGAAKKLTMAAEGATFVASLLLAFRLSGKSGEGPPENCGLVACLTNSGDARHRYLRGSMRRMQRYNNARNRRINMSAGKEEHREPGGVNARGVEAASAATAMKASQERNDDRYAFDVVNEGEDKRLKQYNICCSQGGCK